MLSCTNCTGEPQVPVTEKPDTTKPDTTEHETPVQDTTCSAKGFQQVSICVPVTVIPFAHAGKTVTKCLENQRWFQTISLVPELRTEPVLLKSVRQYVLKYRLSLVQEPPLVILSLNA